MRLMNTLLGAAALAAGFATISPAIAPPPPEVVEIPVVEKSWKCPDCNDNEKYVLEQLQAKTKIRDRNAIATIMGNIKQESNFVPDICEGGIEFLTTLAIVGVMVLFSGLSRALQQSW